MKPADLKLILDKITESIPDTKNAQERFVFREQIRKDIKRLVESALEGMKKEVEMYGTNTHSATAVQAYLIEFRRIV